MIWRTRSAYAEKGLDYALYDVSRSGQPLKYDTDQEAEVVALACSQPPQGARRWTIRLLTVAACQRPQLASINRESVRQILKKRLSTLAQSDVVHRADNRRVSGADVRRVGPLCPAV